MTFSLHGTSQHVTEQGEARRCLVACRPRMEPLDPPDAARHLGRGAPSGGRRRRHRPRTARRLAAVLLDAGLAGIYTSGSAGELRHAWTSASTTPSARWSQAAAAERGVPFQLGASQMSGQLSLARIRRSRSRAGGVPGDPAGLAPARPRRGAGRGRAPGRGGRPGAARAVQPAARQDAPGSRGVRPAGGGGSGARGDQDRRARIPRSSPPSTPPRRRSRSSSPDTRSPRAAGTARAAPTRTWPASARTARRPGALAGRRPRRRDPLERRIQAFLAEHVGPFQRAGYANPALDKLLASAGGWAQSAPGRAGRTGSSPRRRARRLAPIARRALPELFPS